MAARKRPAAVEPEPLALFPAPATGAVSLSVSLPTALVAAAVQQGARMGLTRRSDVIRLALTAWVQA
jgi:hypothetical protein